MVVVVGFIRLTRCCGLKFDCNDNKYDASRLSDSDDDNDYDPTGFSCKYPKNYIIHNNHRLAN